MAEKETAHKTVKTLSEEIELNGGGVWIKDMILGQGGQATVYLGIPVLPNHPFIAVKYVPLWSDDEHDDDHLFDLSEECEIFLELKPSPHIIQFLGEYYTVDKEGNTIFDLCFEYAPGGSLHDRIQSTNGGQGLDEMDVRGYTRSILKGLMHIHDQDLVHCDLKPQNILIYENNVVKIADFGLAVKRDRLPRNRNNTLYRGTHLYVAPEEIHSQSFEPISNIWGLWWFVLEMLTDTDPSDFDPKTDRESIVRYIASTKDLPMIPAEISNLAKDFLSYCLVRDTKLRWTADMLMGHPFIYSINEEIYINNYLQKLRKEEIEIENKKKRKREAAEAKNYRR